MSIIQILLYILALLNTYVIRVITGTESGSGTNANVHIIIFGDHDDTGQIILNRSKTHKDPFENGHTDIFEIEASDIGEPRKIRIGHDNSGFRPDWFLERVEIDVPKYGRTWVFPSGKWISKSKGDRELEIELFPNDEAALIYNPKIPYEIKVYTSNIGSAGTDANVHIEIYGKQTSTGQVMLCSKTERKGKFQKGSVDEFVLELDDVGETIEKIRIGHDNKGIGAAWHLNRVEIRRLLGGQKTETYVFPCDKWFSKKDDDRQIVRDLLPEKIIKERVDRDGKLVVKEKEVTDHLEMKEYQVDVYTGDKSGAGTDANVFVTIFGNKGDSGERELARSETHGNKFERNQMDRFRISCADLGDIYKVVVRHDDSNFGSDWFLDRIEVVDDVTTYMFHCEQWLAKGKGDKKIERKLYEKNYQGSKSSLGSFKRSVAGSIASVVSGSSDKRDEPFHQNQKKNIMTAISEENRDPDEERIPYTVRVKTGTDSNAGTSANVMIRLNGFQGQQTRWIPLEVIPSGRFERGKVETFSLEEKDIGDLEVAEIKHDGETPADSWFLDDITIEIPTKGRVYYFPCKQWLSKHKDDGKTKRVLRVEDKNRGTFRPLITYELSVQTGDVEEAGTDCDVSLKLFGTEGSSSDFLIKKQEGYFERGAIDNLICELEDVGKLLKVIVTIIPKKKKDRNKWYLESIKLVKKKTKGRMEETFFFGLNDFISAEHDYSREIPLTKGSRAQIEETTYRITVKTSDMDGAGSDSTVFIVLSGQNGDSKEFELDKSSTYSNKFERNHEDVFTFEKILSLGELTKVRVRINESFFKADWHLEYVKVEDLGTDKTYMFPCGKWLSSKKDDKQIVRELVCEDAPAKHRRGSLEPGEKVPYQIEITTSDKDDAGTTQYGWIRFTNKRKQSEKFYMKNTERKKVLRRGQTDTFKFLSRPLDNIKSIILGHEERPDYPLRNYEGRKSQWHVAHVTVTDLTTDVRYEFRVGKWIRLNDEGMEFDCLEKSEGLVSQQRHRETIKYKIIVYTGDVSGAGTDANVFVILYGTLGDTGKRELKQRGRNLFERKQKDEFVIEALDLGQITKLHIEHDNANPFADWFLDRVEVINMETQEKVSFPCNRWLSKDKDDKEIQRDLLPIHGSNDDDDRT